MIKKEIFIKNLRLIIIEWKLFKTYRLKWLFDLLYFINNIKTITTVHKIK